MIVVDASVFTAAFVGDDQVGGRARAELRRDAQWIAPDHVVAEVFAGIRGLWLGGKVELGRAERGLDRLRSAVIDLVPTLPLVARMWDRRDNVTGYDAAYLTLAETLGCPFVTADARLARVPELSCEVRVV